MKPESKSQNPTSKRFFAALLLFLPFFISALTCGTLVQDESQKETDIVQDVQATLNAQKVMTLEAQQTLLASEETVLSQPIVPNADSTLQAQQATIDAQSTILAVNGTPTIEPTGTVTEQPTLSSTTASAPVLITEWTMQYWVPLSSGCRFPNSPCWKTNDDTKIHNGEGMLVLQSKKRVFIDPSSKSPYLVFWHKPNLKQEASVSIEVDGKWIIVMNLTKIHSSDWRREYIDLSNFIGKDILIRFASDVDPGASDSIWGGWGRIAQASKTSVWFIQNVQILPECTPP